MLTLTVKNYLKQLFIFQKEAKTAPNRQILFCLVYLQEVFAILPQF